MANYQYTGRGLHTNTGIIAQTMPLTIAGSGYQSSAGLSTAQIQALTSTSISNNHTLSTSGLFAVSESTKRHPDVKKYEIYESPEDLLALSVAWKKQRDGGYSNLMDPRLFKVLTPEDQMVADSIRDYYSKKIMMWKLKGIKLTPYREDLNMFVHADGKKFREEMLGLAYYLPEFYEFDVSLDEVRLQVDVPPKSFNGISTKTLLPLKRITKKNKRITNIQYWFKDVETNSGVTLTIIPKNPLEHIWNHLFETKELLSISGHYYTTNKYEFEHFSIRNWNLVQG